MQQHVKCRRSELISSWHGSSFLINGPLCGKSTCQCWILYKVSLMQTLYDLCIVSLNKFFNRNRISNIWDTSTLMWCHLNVVCCLCAQYHVCERNKEYWFFVIHSLFLLFIHIYKSLFIYFYLHICIWINTFTCLALEIELGTDYSWKE